MKKHQVIQHHAKKHHEAQLNLKTRVERYHPIKENIFPIFVATFVLAFTGLILMKAWGEFDGVIKSKDINQPIKEVQLIQSEVQSMGFKTAAISNYRIDQQSNRANRSLLASIEGIGSKASAKATTELAKERTILMNENGINNSIWVTNYLSTGQQLTLLDKKQAKALQKSILSTYYLGEKTVDINSIIQSDSKILSQIKNALSVDVFKYLNQAISRSDALDDYLGLLSRLSSKADERLIELNNKTAFLNANSKSKEQQIKLSEELFFDNIKIFDGSNADEELRKFVGLQESQVEIKAKIGAYNSLKGYYDFFKPQLDNLINEIKLNREALIAGVKVTEIQNMQLPLIIRTRN